MKILINLAIIVALIFGGMYFFNNNAEFRDVINKIKDNSELVSNFIDKVKENIGNEEEDEPRFVININKDSDIALVSTREDGLGVVVVSKKVGKGEVIDKIIINSPDGKKGTLSIDAKSLPSSFAVDGYSINFSNYKKDTVDIEIVNPDGSREKELSVPIGIPKTSFNLPQGHFLWGVKSASAGEMYEMDDIMIYNPDGTLNEEFDRGDKNDVKYYFDVVGTAWNVIACGGGLVTSIIPNPISAFTAAVGCTSLLAKATTVEENDIEGCDSSENLYECATKKIMKGVFGDGKITLQGRVVSSTNQADGLAGVEVEIIDTKRKTSVKAITKNVGGYSLKLGSGQNYDIVARGKDSKVEKFKMVFDDNNVKILDEAGKEVSAQYDPKLKKIYFDIPISVANVYISNFSTRDPLNLGRNIYGDIAGEIKIYFNKDNSITCELKADGRLVMTNAQVDGSLYDGPVTVFSNSCVGERKNDEIKFTGTVSGSEPYPLGVDAKEMEKYATPMMGKIKNETFYISTKIEGGSISGNINIIRLSFQGIPGGGIAFTAMPK